MTVNVVTSTDLRNSLSDKLDEVSGHKRPTLIRRRNSADVALISVDMLEELLELYDRKFVASIAKAREEIAQGRTHTLKEIFG